METDVEDGRSERNSIVVSLMDDWKKMKDIYG